MRSKNFTIGYLIILSSLFYMAYGIITKEKMFLKIWEGEFSPNFLLLIHGILAGIAIKMLWDKYWE